jgi:hypothetical protein
MINEFHLIWVQVLLVEMQPAYPHPPPLIQSLLHPEILRLFFQRWEEMDKSTTEAWISKVMEPCGFTLRVLYTSIWLTPALRLYVCISIRFVGPCN